MGRVGLGQVGFSSTTALSDVHKVDIYTKVFKPKKILAVLSYKGAIYSATVVVVVVVDIISPNVGTPRLRVEQFGV